jgi:hypothetical protein
MLSDLLIDIAFPELRLDRLAPHATCQGGLTPKKKQCYDANNEARGKNGSRKAKR